MYTFIRSLLSVLAAIALFTLSALSEDGTFLACGIAVLVLNQIACCVQEQQQ